MADSPLGEDEPCCDLGVAHALGDELEHLELARRQSCRVLASCTPRPAWQAARTQLAEPSRHDRSRGARRELLELVEWVTQCPFVVRAGPRERSLVGAAGLVPESGGVCPVPRELSGIRLRHARRDLILELRPAAPECELPENDWVTVIDRDRDRVLSG